MSTLRQLLQPVLIAAISLLWTGLANEAIAQDGNVDAMLDCFASAFASGDPEQRGDGDVRCGGTIRLGLTAVLSDPEAYPHMYEPIMDGLEEMAVHDPDRRVRYNAAAWMTAPGDAVHRAANSPGVMARIRRVYESSDDPSVRSLLVELAPRQAETGAAAEFLVRAATQNGRAGEQGLPVEVLAIDAIARLDGGEAILRDMYRRGSVTSPAGRVRLEALVTDESKE